jgi:hypothetical protein
MSDMDYQSTACLPDDEGKALLAELSRLSGAIWWDAEKAKPRNRRISPAERQEREAIASLRVAIIKTAARFERHEDFTAWLCRNNREDIEAYDPIRGRDEQVDAIRNLQWKVEILEDALGGTNKFIAQLVSERLATAKAGQ